MKKILNALFLVCICAALLLALGYVVLQATAVVTANGSLAMWASNNLEAPVCIMCSLTAVVAFIMSYVFRWKSGD